MLTKETTPSRIVRYLDQYVIGQDEAKRTVAVAVYSHYRKISTVLQKSGTIAKSNVLLIGSSGTGKTLLCETLSHMLGVPFVTADATSLAQTKYVNEEIEAILQRLVDKANGDLRKAALGIVFIEMFRAAREHFRRIAWVACLSLAATPLLGFPIFPSNHAALMPAFVLILLLVSERWNRRQILVGFIVLASGFLIPYGLYSASLVFSSYAYKDLLAILPPTTTILALYWMRWFAVRSPRTWSDQVGLRK